MTDEYIVKRARKALEEGKNKELIRRTVKGLVKNGSFLLVLIHVFESRGEQDPVLLAIEKYHI